MVVGSQRRAQRRNRRSIDDLDAAGRTRLQELLASARLALLPTSEAIPSLEARLSPGAVALAVTCTAELGIDQTIAVSEVLAARGYDVTPHIAARQVRTGRHLDEILLRLARRGITRVFVVQGRQSTAGAFPTSLGLLEAMQGHPQSPAEVGVAGYPDGHHRVDRDRLTAGLLARAGYAGFVSTQVSLHPARLLGWLAEMRVRGLSLPVELGIPGVVQLDRLRRQDPGLAAVVPAGRGRNPAWYDPTGLVAALADQAVMDRLNVSGLRVETLNAIDAAAAWRQQIYDFTQKARTDRA